jgi:hypothetical protein
MNQNMWPLGLEGSGIKGEFGHWILIGHGHFLKIKLSYSAPHLVYL